MACPKFTVGEGIAFVILLSLWFNFSMFPWGSPSSQPLPSLRYKPGKKEAECWRADNASSWVGMQTEHWPLNSESCCCQVGSSGLEVSGKAFIRCRGFPADRRPGLFGWFFHLRRVQAYRQTDSKGLGTPDPRERMKSVSW